MTIGTHFVRTATNKEKKMPRPDSKRTPLAKVRTITIKQARKRKQLLGSGR
jgi:hypothetical protein